MHNLKNIDVQIPHNQLTVITGLSGSGKTSLAFDTLYAEGQRRYIESMSSYARQFLGKFDKPEVDFIKGISPAVAIQQKVISNNPRSTVGTVTEIYDYLKILFAREGKTIDPISGQEVKKHKVQDVIEVLRSKPAGTKALVLAPIHSFEKYGNERQLRILFEQGYTRLWFNEEVITLEDILDHVPDHINQAELLIDRISTQLDEGDEEARIADSISLAFAEGSGTCFIYFTDTKERLEFSNLFEVDGRPFTEPSVHFFTFNNPFGACKRCDGYGSVIGIDETLVIPNPSLSVYEGAIAPWKGDTMKEYAIKLIKNAEKFNFPVHRPIEDLTEDQYELLWKGNSHFMGLHEFFEDLESKTYKIQYRIMLSRYRGKSICPDCKGTRLRKDASYVKLQGKSLIDLVLMPIKELKSFFDALPQPELSNKVLKRILPEITSRLSFLMDVGLEYLTLNRTANTLSGGESQRINLATSLGSSLVGSMYVLDEPSIGLHPYNTQQLVSVLRKLRDAGNTVIVVEHEEEIIQSADQIVDMGPGAGRFGGEVVFSGNHQQLIKSKSLTAGYITGKKEIPVPKKRRPLTEVIAVRGANKHNLKNFNVDIPLFQFVCISGISGSGKSTLIKEILVPGIKEMIMYGNVTTGFHLKSLAFDLRFVEDFELVDQNPIGKSSRSNPATYVKAFDDIRALMAAQPLAKQRNYSQGDFSFNVDGGRCEVCEGEGEIKVSMQFMADVYLKCEACNGTRYKSDLLDVTIEDKNIHDILEMDIAEAIPFFEKLNNRLANRVVEKIKPFADVGLEYLKLGQSSSTLSGGEAQRVKLASFLVKGGSNFKTLFIFDEPTTGLHFQDVEKLIIAFDRLIEEGHSIIVIEHNLDVIKCADTVIDLGPKGGKEGGQLIFAGKPEDLVKEKNSYTGQFLREKLASPQKTKSKP